MIYKDIYCYTSENVEEIISKKLNITILKHGSEKKETIIGCITNIRKAGNPPYDPCGFIVEFENGGSDEYMLDEIKGLEDYRE